MSRILVVTDSASDLEPPVAEAAGVRIVPLDVRAGDLSPEVAGRLSLAEFWERCTHGDFLPETSAPSPGAFHDAFIKAKDDGYNSVVCVTISSDLSATYQAACTGASAAAGQIEVAVVDSRSATMGEGMAVLEAARLAAGGAALDPICDAVRDQLARTTIYGALDTLDYLRRGGRIGAAQAAFGSLLSIKPVIELRDGVVVGESRQRTRARSLRYLADKVAALGPLQRLAVVHAAAAEDDLGRLLELLAPLEVAEPTTVGYIGPVIGAHTGPGTVGVCAVRA